MPPTTTFLILPLVMKKLIQWDGGGLPSYEFWGDNRSLVRNNLLNKFYLKIVG